MAVVDKILSATITYLQKKRRKVRHKQKKLKHYLVKKRKTYSQKQKTP